MNRKQFQEFLEQFPEDAPVKLLTDGVNKISMVDMEAENVILTAETAYIDPEAPEEEWDTEDGKWNMGTGDPYILVNPFIM